jgi:N-methylhydantoinase B
MSRETRRSASFDDLLGDRDIDPVTLQVIGGELDTIAEEMSYKLIRSAYSSLIRESEDLGAGLFTADGREICESDTTPMQVGSMVSIPGHIRAAIRERGEDPDAVISPGDVFVHNHPHHGATHSPDMAIFVPIFHGGDHVAWAATNAHHLDIGAATPGLAVDLEDVYAEGNLFRGIKLYDGGDRVDQLWHYLRENLRKPRVVLNDIQAQISACHAGRKRYESLIEEYGLTTVQRAQDDLMAYSEALLREEIAQLPDGTYTAESHLDDDGRNRGETLPVHAELTVEGDEITIDLSESADQTPTGFNVPFEGSTKVSAYFVVRAVLMDTHTHDEFIPQNSGTFEPITVTAREGSIFNPTPPAAAFARSYMCVRMCDVLMEAFSEVVPDRVCAGTGAHGYFVSYAGTDEDGEYWLYVEVNEGSYGGRPDRDGMDAVDVLFSNTQNQPTEDLELTYPLRVEQYELNTEDPPGAGRTRGGFGVLREMEFFTDVSVTSSADGHTQRRWGFDGGHDGSQGALEHVSGDDRSDLPAKVSGYKFDRGDRIRIKTANGGGYGDPHERPAQEVYDDYRDGFVSADEARSVYGVVVEDGELDREATARLRGRDENDGGES